MVYIYVLKLKNNKYYVGKSTNPSTRLEDHFSEFGSAWTKKYKPITIHEIKPDCDDDDENKITLQHMKKYGIDNVRGGSFCQLNLPQNEIDVINKMIKGSSDKCYQCGGDHFIKDCPNKLKKKQLVKHKKIQICERCGRENHSADKCYAKKDVNNEEIIDGWKCEYCGRVFDTEKGCRFHENVHCKKKNTQKKATNITCYRCGRDGHKSTECYATTNIDGDYIDDSSDDDY